MAYRHSKGEVTPERDDPARDDPERDDPERDDPEKDDPERDDKFSTRIYAEEYIRPQKMATLKEKSKKIYYNYSTIIGKNPHLRSLTVDEFSQKIHAETNIRPHKMADLNEKMGSTGSPSRHMSPRSTQNEATAMQISPQNVAKLKKLIKIGSQIRGPEEKMYPKSRAGRENVSKKWGPEKGKSPKSDIQTESVIKLKFNLRPLNPSVGS